MDFRLSGEFQALVSERITWAEVLEIINIQPKTQTGFYRLECLVERLYCYSFRPPKKLQLFPSKQFVCSGCGAKGDIVDFILRVCTQDELENLWIKIQEHRYYCHSNKQIRLPFD